MSKTHRKPKREWDRKRDDEDEDMKGFLRSKQKHDAFVEYHTAHEWVPTDDYRPRKRGGKR